MNRILQTLLVLVWLPGILLAQTFTFETPELFVQKSPGELIVFHNNLINNTNSQLNFRVIRTVNNLPTSQWGSSICVGDSATGLCYPPWVDTTMVHVLPGSESEPILLDVTTDPNTPGEATITLKVENADNPAEFAEQTFTASTMPTAIPEEPLTPTGSFRLLANYPNPFNPSTVIPFEVGGVRRVRVRIFIYNILGQKVLTLLDKDFIPGVYEVAWNGRNARGESVSSGVYFYEMQTGSQRMVRRLLLIR